MTALAASGEIIGAAGAAPRIEAMLPAGVRARQRSVRTLLPARTLARAGGRPARLARAHQALAGPPEDEQRRLGVLADRKHGPRQLTCRPAGRAFALAADEPSGLPPPEPQAACGQLLEASVPQELTGARTSLAADRTDTESFSRPPPRGTRDCAGPEAGWGRRLLVYETNGGSSGPDIARHARRAARGLLGEQRETPPSVRNIADLQPARLTVGYQPRWNLLAICPVDGRHIKHAFPLPRGCIPYWRSQRE
ncbi:MAG TPA: hypothetical protein VFQ68_15040, partial [Streptosporangiaceae bacterium]|nr:hypothetical protein [Streptosporangiaceae bacterium]